MSKSPREQLDPFIAFAFVEFGMSEEQFLLQTPLAWVRIMEAWSDRERRADRRTARICAVLVGGSEEDFIPRPSSEEDSEQTIDEMCGIIIAVAGQKPNG